MGATPARRMTNPLPTTARPPAIEATVPDSPPADGDNPRAAQPRPPAPGDADDDASEGRVDEGASPDEAPTDDTPTDEEAAPASDQSGAGRRRRLSADGLLFVAADTEDDAADATDAEEASDSVDADAAEAPPAEAVEPKEESAPVGDDAGEQDAEQPAGDEPDAGQPDEEPALPPKNTGEAEPAGDSDLDLPPAGGDSDGGDSDLDVDVERVTAEPKYKPLEEVADEIRQTLAAEPAEKRLTAALAELRQRLAEYKEQLLLASYGAEELAETPGDFDFQAEAEQLGLQSGGTALIDVLEIEELPDTQLGQSYQLLPGSNNFRPQRRPYRDIAFAEGLDNYQAIRVTSRWR